MRGNDMHGEAVCSHPRPGRTRCPWHDPTFAEQRRTWSGRGGRNKANHRRAPRDLADAALTMPQISGLLSIALRNVATGTMELGPANALANLARAIVITTQAGDVEARLAELEAIASITERRTA